jgi:hypothetical protein
MKVNLLNDGPVTIIIDSKIESKMDLKNSQLDVDNWIKNMEFVTLTN